MNWKSGTAAAMDHAWLSFMNLAVSFVFIRLASKEEYGIYLLLLTPLYLIQGVQNALLLSPIATVLPATPADKKQSVINTAIAGQIVFLACFAVLAAISLVGYFYVKNNSIELWLALSFALAIAGSSAREGARALHYANEDALKAFRSDLIYGVGFLGMLAVIAYMGALSGGAVLAAMGFAALWPYVLQSSHISKLSLDRDVLKKFWACGRWALVGVLVTWINMSAYPLVVGAMLSLSQVADINAARLFLMPVVVGVTAWSTLIRPKISAYIAAGKVNEVRQLTLKSIYIGLTGLVLFSVMITTCYPLLERILGKAYQGLFPLVVMWAIGSALGLVRAMFSASLMTNPEGYKQLQYASWIALVFSLGGLWFLTPYGSLWVVGVLAFVDLIQLLWIGWKASIVWQEVKP